MEKSKIQELFCIKAKLGKLSELAEERAMLEREEYALESEYFKLFEEVNPALARDAKQTKEDFIKHAPWKECLTWLQAVICQLDSNAAEEHYEEAKRFRALVWNVVCTAMVETYAAKKQDDNTLV